MFLVQNTLEMNIVILYTSLIFILVTLIIVCPSTNLGCGSTSMLNSSFFRSSPLLEISLMFFFGSMIVRVNVSYLYHRDYFLLSDDLGNDLIFFLYLVSFNEVEILKYALCPEHLYVLV